MERKEKVKLTEKKVIDQFDSLFDGMINIYSTPASICGYVVCAMSEELCVAGPKTLPEVINKAKWINQSRLSRNIEKAMESIQLARSQYCSDVGMSAIKARNYLRDWVANYEIEDYLKSAISHFDNKNVYFLRVCAYDHPEAMKKVDNEEAIRVVVQEPFKGQGHFVTMFQPFTHLTIEAWKDVLCNRGFATPIVIIVDLLGHFTTMVYHQRELIIMDSMSPSWLEKEAVILLHSLFDQIV